jgi:hypothetical protein
MTRIGAILVLLLASGCGLDPLVGGDCLDGWIACDGVCIDPMTDESSCGACGDACTEGAQCFGGHCAGGGCEPPEVWCDAAACADLQTDPANCGACGFACPAGARCASGSCVADCPPELLDCDGACVDPSTDARHCGGCGIACEEVEVCVDSTCTVGCPDGTTQCGRQCVDTSSDREHCGACESPCLEDQVCEAGTCTACDVDESACGNVCVELDSDPDHCGACGNACAALEECLDGACVLPCPDPLRDCRAGVCVDVATDPEHCGACDTPCGVGRSCHDGTCVDDCGEGLTSCARQCVDVSSDPDNCGGCGIVCDTGICDSGRCRAGAIGHLVVIGHDYVRTRRDQGRLVANAVLIAQGEVTAVTYDDDADPAGVANVEAAVLQAADDAGRTVTLVPLADPQLLGEGLVDADVFLVHAQGTAEPDTLSALGELWLEALVAFLTRGGVVVVLDGPATDELGGTWRIVTAAELLAISGSTDVTGQTLDLVDPGDAVALGMAVSYRAEQHSVSFTAPDGSPVVAAAAEPVVMHEVFLP